MTEGEENIIIKGVLLEAISRDFSEELSNNKEVSVSPRFKRQMMAMMNNPNKWAERHKRDYRRRFVKVVATIVLTCSLPFSYMLNANTSTWNCDVYTSNSDTYVNFEKVSTGVYYIRLKSHPERYLTAGGTKSGSDVSWEKLSTTTAGKKAQQWKVTATSLPTVYTRVTSGADSLGDDQMETNAEYIYNYLKKKGFTKNAICGILGNMNSESTINPAVWQSLNDMYLGYGLVQWDDGKLFIDWAKKEGVISAATAEAVNSLAYSNPKKLMDAELDYLIVSMNTVGNWFKPDNNQSKYGTSETLTASQFKVSNKSADILARIFCGHYERPGVPKISERVANAKKWYNFL
ncbi:phage tail tip lysozyme [Clostridium sp. DFI.5.61]|nr:phage tail tip lysozyme [Clostridium sp. DFI.5.61]MCB5927718.1 phage tail-type lysozyme domain-containing protein [bacterium 210820-DFI.5.26]MCQ5161112.1 phage tail tip lysozyme [Clostridium sp. DFI.5.61]